MFCTGCGNRINESEKYCRMCGTKNNHYNGDLEQSSGEDMQESRSVPQGVNAIQPEVVILPREQMGQAKASGEMPRMEAGNVIIEHPVTAPKKIKRPAKEIGLGIKIGSVFLSILAFVLTILLITSLFAKTILSQKTLEASVQKIDYINMELGDLLADSDLEIEVNPGDTTIDIVYEALTKQGEVDISRSDVEELFEETTFSDYISEKLSSYARYAVTGAEPEEISSREIVRLVRENRKVIEETANLKITEDDLNQLESYLEEDRLLDSISIKKIDETLSENKVDGIRKILSDTVLLVIIIVSMLLLVGDIVLISVLHRRVRAPLAYIGIPLLAGGLLFTVVLLVVNIIKPRLFNGIKEIYASIKPFVSAVLMKGILIGAITAVIGMLMVAGLIVIKRVQKREEQIKTME